MADRIVREPERQRITGLSRPQWWRLEREGQAPRRIKLTDRAIGWRESDLLEWVDQRARVSAA